MAIGGGPSAQRWTGPTQGEVHLPTRSGWSLRLRVGLVLGLLGVLTLAEAVAVVQAQRVVASANQDAVRAGTVGADVLRLQVGMERQSAALAAYQATRDGGELDSFTLAQNQVGTSLRTLRADDGVAADQPHLAQVTNAVRSWQAWAGQRQGALSARQPIDAADTVTGSVLLSAFNNAAGNLEQVSHAEAEAAAAAAAAEARRIAGLVAVVAGAGFAAFVLLGFIFFSSTLRPVSDLVGVSIALASGRRVTIPWLARRDEIGQLAKALGAWDRSSRERLVLARARTDLNRTGRLEDVLDIGAQRFQDEVAAAQVVFTIAVEGSWRVMRSIPIAAPSAGVLPHSPEAQVLQRRASFLGDLRDGAWDERIRAWRAANDYGPVMALPLVSGGHLLGAVTAVRRVNQPGFAPIDADLAEIVVPSLASAIHVALLAEYVAGLDRARPGPGESNSARGAPMPPPSASDATRVMPVGDRTRGMDAGERTRVISAEERAWIQTLPGPGVGGTQPSPPAGRSRPDPTAG